MQAGRMQLEPGSRLDRYELLCPIAHGGMASVWLARFSGKHGFEKLVAVKTILPEFAQDTRFQQMFLDEARIASGIEHVNVAHILDLGEQHDVLFIVMEWVDGDSLSKLHRAVERRGERVPLGIALRIMADACGGLHAAHELTDKTGHSLGVVHRDVSPQNILVSVKGNAKLIDFGIAKALVRLSGETNAGLLKGKIQYMAPEQAMGRALDRRADVWAAGACLYYLLSGIPPFEGENQLATLHMLTGGQPPPPLPPNVPPMVVDVVMRALAFDPQHRTPTAADLQRQLEQAMLTCGVPTTTTDVAAFVARELGDRADARKQAIDVALQAASARAQTSTSIMASTMGTPSGVSSSPLAQTHSPLSHTTGSAPGTGTPVGSHPGMQREAGPATMANTVLAPAPGNHPPPPSRVTGPATTGDPNDPISQVSNATLGAAAVAYPQGSLPPPALKKNGGGGAAIFGVFALVVLGVGAAFWYKHEAARSFAHAPVTPPPTAVIATSAITSDVTSAAPTTSAAPPLTASAEPIAPASASAAPSASAVAARASAASAPSGGSKPPSHSSSTKGSGTTKSTASSSHPSSTDYGF